MARPDAMAWPRDAAGSPSGRRKERTGELRKLKTVARSALKPAARSAPKPVALLPAGTEEEVAAE
jgi:hypothetical protein